jgi:hypothetical protein
VVKHNKQLKYSATCFFQQTLNNPLTTLACATWIWSFPFAVVSKRKTRGSGLQIMAIALHCKQGGTANNNF